MVISAKKKALMVGVLPLLICATLIANTVIWGFAGFAITSILTFSIGLSTAIAINVYDVALKHFEGKTNENTTTNNSTNYTNPRRF
jgi:predicted cobalt transporter CbtA